MSKFKSELTLKVTGTGPGVPSVNKKYNLDHKDAMTLMNNSDQFVGVQGDIISVTRVGVASGNLTLGSKGKQGATLTIKTHTDADDGSPSHDGEISWHGLDQSQVQAAINAINARLVAVGITP
jgi:hypothetical protein